MTEPQPDREPLPLGVLVGVWGVSAALLLSAVVWAAVRVWPEKTYPTDTPQAVIETAGRMLADRRPDRLVELLEPVPPDQAATEHHARTEDLYRRLGRVLAAAQDLHRAVERRMPEELERLNTEIQAAEARGEAASLLAAFMPDRRRGRTPDDPQRDAARERALAQILADPFGRLNRALTEHADRVGVAELSADTVAITFDDRPVLPPFGLTMRRHPDGWRVVPPTSLPLIRRYAPDTDAEFQVWGSLLATVEALLDDLRRDVESGRVDSLQQLSRKAIEDAVIPIGMVMVALGRAED